MKAIKRRLVPTFWSALIAAPDKFRFWFLRETKESGNATLSRKGEEWKWEGIEGMIRTSALSFKSPIVSVISTLAPTRARNTSNGLSISHANLSVREAREYAKWRESSSLNVQSPFNTFAPPKGARRELNLLHTHESSKKQFTHEMKIPRKIIEFRKGAWVKGVKLPKATCRESEASTKYRRYCYYIAPSSSKTKQGK